MFEYLRLYKERAAGQHGRVIGFSILQIILCMIIPSLVIFALMFLPLLLTFTDASEATVGVSMIIWSLVAMLLYIGLMIFVIYPIMAGILRYFAFAYNGETVSFNQAYDVFKNGNYSKLIKLTLLSILFYFVISLVIGFIVNILVTIIILPIAPLGMLIENPDSAMQGVSIVMMIFLIILAIIISILAYIPYIILFIYLSLVFMVYIDEPRIPTMDKFKIAWNIAFKSRASMVKLFFSNLLYYIGMIILIFVIIIGFSLLAAFAVGGEQPFIMFILMFLMFIILIALSVWIYYRIVGSIVAYYFVGRASLDEMEDQRAESTLVKDNPTDDLE